MTPPDATPFLRRLADRAVSVVCPAKINLTLSVGPPRPDGMHPIDSLMLGLGHCFADTLSLEALDELPSRFSRSFAQDAPLRQTIDWPIASDLACRAHGLMQEYVGRGLPIAANLIKRIPAGSGLGGGSADAAGMMVGLNVLFDLGLSSDQLVQLGLRLGSDIGFAVHIQLGHRAARVSGIGDVIDPVQPHNALNLVLILPDVPCPTEQVYRAFDRLSGELDHTRPHGAELYHQRVVDLLSLEPSNDLVQAAMLTAPKMREIAESCRELGQNPHVTGSGSAMYLVCETFEIAEQHSQSLSRMGVAAIRMKVEKEDRS
ncbi:MAG: hypothetical protein AAGC44_13435 [Planctomycetota bacterium]